MEPAPKDAESTSLLAGFTDKECKLLAAAYLSSTGVNPEKVCVCRFKVNITLRLR